MDMLDIIVNLAEIAPTYMLFILFDIFYACV
jgi:hypothetical protein